MPLIASSVHISSLPVKTVHIFDLPGPLTCPLNYKSQKSLEAIWGMQNTTK